MKKLTFISKFSTVLLPSLRPLALMPSALDYAEISDSHKEMEQYLQGLL
jgi:hypothetical protein